jgi:hypothetical protein
MTRFAQLEAVKKGLTAQADAPRLVNQALIITHVPSRVRALAYIGLQGLRPSCVRLVTVVFRTAIAFVMIALVIAVTAPAASTPETTRQT